MRFHGVTAFDSSSPAYRETGRGVCTLLYPTPMPHATVFHFGLPDAADGGWAQHVPDNGERDVGSECREEGPA